MQRADRYAGRLVLLAADRIFGREAARSEALLHAEGKARAGQTAGSTDAFAKLLLRPAARRIHLGSYRQGTDAGIASCAGVTRFGDGDRVGVCRGPDILARSIFIASSLALRLAMLNTFASDIILAQ